jgi:hypothetical protein
MMSVRFSRPRYHPIADFRLPLAMHSQTTFLHRLVSIFLEVSHEAIMAAVNVKSDRLCVKLEFLALPTIGRFEIDPRFMSPSLDETLLALLSVGRIEVVRREKKSISRLFHPLFFRFMYSSTHWQNPLRLSQSREVFVPTISTRPSKCFLLIWSKV